MAIGDVISRLAVSLTLETAAFEKGAAKASGTVGKLQGKMQGLTAKFSGFGAAIGGVAAAAGLSSIVSDAVEMATSLSEAAGKVGVTVEALQELRFAAEQNGVSTEQLDALLVRLNKSLGDLQLGSKSATAAFAKIGLSANELKGLAPDQALRLIADALNKLPDVQQRVAIGQQLMGRNFSALLPLLNQGSAGLDAAAEATRKHGEITTEDARKLDDLADKWDELKKTIGIATANILADVAPLSDTFQKWADDFDAYNARTAKSARDNGTTIQAGFRQIGDALHSFSDSINGAMQRAHAFFANMIDLGRNMALGLARGIKNAGSAVWDALKGVVTGGIANAKALLGIHSPSLVFQEIGDYIGQGLAIGIEGGTGRVAAATKKLTEAARQAAEETRALFARLFPELEKANQYRADLARIDASGQSSDAQSEARFRLGQEFLGRGDVPVTTYDVETDNIGSNVDELLAKFDLFGKKAGAVTVNVAKSFKDMADATVQSLSNLANSIKGGGFLDILSSVIGLGLQLGSIGAFGKTIAGRINAPKYANGTNFHPGGLAVVGERGPELVSMPRGSRVTPNGEWGGGRGSVVVNINAKDAVLTHQVRQWVAEGMAIAVDKGADLGVARVGYRQRRRVA